MHLEYVHYFGNESNESTLEAHGLKPRAEEIDKTKPKQLHNCNEDAVNMVGKNNQCCILIKKETLKIL